MRRSGDRGGRLARLAYSALLQVLQPLYLLRLWWRGRREAAYRRAIGERFGRYAGRPKPDPAQPDRAPVGDGDAPGPQQPSPCVWIHAVSLGETRAAATLVTRLRHRCPTMTLVLTHSTATGREAGAELLAPGDRQAWLPYDTPAAVAGFFEAFRPDIGVLMETEIWPNLLAAAHARGLPIVLANARLSERSLRKGQRLQALLQPAIGQITLALAQTDADASRLREAGAPRVVVEGNIKFDMTPDPQQIERGLGWARDSGRPIVLAASTREGEEGPLLDAWVAAWPGVPEPAGTVPAPNPVRPRLLVVPRHPQRFEAVADLLARSGLPWARRSSFDPDGGLSPAAQSADLWLGDSMGEMAAYYAASRVALLGGSFAPLGGQNLIEAAACGCPVLCGPHTFNFADAAERAIDAGAAARVPDIVQAVTLAIRRCAAPHDELRSLQERCRAFAKAHRGAADRSAVRILSLLPAQGRSPQAAADAQPASGQPAR
jgi:3-deoxy-D-manno-octulosonic-acid transferase